MFLITATFASVQKLPAFILSLTFLVQSFNQGFCYIDYIFRKADYEKRCINKAFPTMHCNGKCQLMKKIMEQEQKEQGQPPEIKFAGKVEVVPSENDLLIKPVQINITKDFTIINAAKPVKMAIAIFHPPPAAAI
ncbi:MAG: hypothetical protein QM640_05880 [Niabella sp.]